MLKKTIIYTDFNDVPQTGDFYFNLSEPELARLELKTGGFEKVIDRWESDKEKYGPEFMDLIETLIKTSYGDRTEDGFAFMKTPEVQELFFHSNAYVSLFMEMFTDPEGTAIIAFFQGILPDIPAAGGA